MSGTSIRPEPAGPRLLHVLGSDVRREPGGDRLLFVDGDDGRPRPGGIRLAYFDGSQIRRRPGGVILLKVKHPDVRTEEEIVRPEGALYAIQFDADAKFGGLGRREGEDLWVALGAPGVELHVLSAKDKEVQKKQAEPALENDVATFTVSFKSPAGAREGIAIKVGDALVAAADPAGGPVEVARWKIDSGNLIGDFFGTGEKYGYYTVAR